MTLFKRIFLLLPLLFTVTVRAETNPKIDPIRSCPSLFLPDSASTGLHSVPSGSGHAPQPAPHKPNVLPNIVTPVADIEAIINRKIVVRTSKLDDASDPLLVRDDGKAPTKLKDGMARLPHTYLMTADVVKTRDLIAEATNKWKPLLRNSLEAQHKESTEMRIDIGEHDPNWDANGVYQSPFLVKYGQLLVSELNMINAIYEKLKADHKLNEKTEAELKKAWNITFPTGTQKFCDPRKMTLGQQEGWIKNHIANKVLDDFKKLFLKNYGEVTKRETDAISDEYKEGRRSEPDFDRLKAQLVRLYEDYLVQLSQKFPVGELNEKQKASLRFPRFPESYASLNSDGLWEIRLNQPQTVLTYVPEIGTVAIRSTAKREIPVAFNLMFYHGAGTPASNSASFVPLMTQAVQFGADPIAFDMPGSVGEVGVAMNSLRSSSEVGVYAMKLGQYTKSTAKVKTVPLISAGRSIGSTDQLMESEIGLEYDMQPVPDLFFSTSTSNPLTMDLQTENVFAQVARGDIKGIIPDAIEHADTNTTDLLRRYDGLLEKNPNALKYHGDSTVHVQGHRDQDGGPNVIKDLYRFRNKYQPLAHVYEIEDHLADLPPHILKKLIEGVNPDFLEATHFLLSIRENNEIAKLRDQAMEVYALMYAMLDYLIDLSPMVPPERREALRAYRLKYTGKNEEMGYLRFFVEKIVNPKIGQNKTLSQILRDPNILPNRSSGVYGRIEKVYRFVYAEARRVRQLMGLPPIN